MASDLTLTDSQKAAVSYVDGSLLVSAAAGSGKTHVLAERCARLVCQSSPPCNVDELLVVTFTRAAASEMRARIERAIHLEIDKRPSDKRLAEQRALLGTLQVGTLHSFCSDLVRKNFHLLGIDPAVRVLGDQEFPLLQIDCIREVFERRYAGDKSGTFAQLVECYAGGYDESLIATIRSLHGLLGSMIDPDAWIAQATARIHEAATKSLDKSALGKQYLGILVAEIHAIRRACKNAQKRLSTLTGFAKYEAFLGELADQCDPWLKLASKGVEALCADVRKLDLGKMPSISDATENKDLAKSIVDSARKRFLKGHLKQLAMWTTAQWQDGLKRIEPLVGELLVTTLHFGELYSARKLDLRALDYNDLEQLALRVLRAPGAKGLEPSDVGLECQRRFRHVLVDEYQDINAVQDAILELVSRERAAKSPATPANLFCVGDVKQSIYGFRLADPDRFRNRDKLLRKSGNPLGKVIDLRENFRSRAPLLHAINSVFSRLMVGGATEIDYDESDHAHWLNPAASYPTPPAGGHAFTGTPIEFHLVEVPRKGSSAAATDTEADEPVVDADRAEREQAVVASRICQLLGMSGTAPTRVFAKLDDGSHGYRDIRPADIAILLRATKEKADQYKTMLRRFGINSILDSATGFFDAVEVLDMLSLLRVIDNQQQDIPLAAVLRSPVFQLEQPDDALAQIRLSSHPGAPFHEAVTRIASRHSDALGTRLKEILSQLEQWRHLSRQSSVADLLQTIYDQTCYPTWCSGLIDGPQRIANLQELLDLARQFDQTQYRGLARFLAFLKLVERDSDLGTPPPVSDDTASVRIMSIHKSKGLEFPVVFIPDLLRKHNTRDQDAMISFDRDAHLGMQTVDMEKRVKYPSLASVVVADTLNKKLLAEELRVLYVAMTRAREHLILIGAGDADMLAGWQSDWEGHHERFPEDWVLSCSSFQHWLGPAAVCANNEISGAFKFSFHSFPDVAKLLASAEARSTKHKIDPAVIELKPLSPAPAGAGAELESTIESLTSPYPMAALTTIPAVQSVTERTKSGTAPAGKAPSDVPIVKFDPWLPPPRFVDSAVTPADIGTATHSALQYLDFSDCASQNAIRAQLKSLVARRLINQRQSDAVDVEAIRWMLSTDVGALLIAHSGELKRELPVLYPEAPTVDGQLIEPGLGLDRVMVRGRIDVLIPTRDGLLVADYKTDHVTIDTIEPRAMFYMPQLIAYARALSRIIGKPVTDAALIFLHPREVRRFQVL